MTFRSTKTATRRLLAPIVAALGLAALLAGCVIVPVGGERGHGHYYFHDGR